MYVWLRHLCIGPKGPLLKIAQFGFQGVVAAAASQRSPCCQNAKYTRGVERYMPLGGLGGRLAQAQRGLERPREVEREQTKPLMRLAGDDQAGSPQISVRNPNRSPRVL